MRIFLAILAVALAASFASMTPAVAQCDPSVCANPTAGGAKAKPHRHAAKPKTTKAVKTAKKPTKTEQYLRVAP